MSDAVTFWLDAAGRKELLTEEQVITLAREIQSLPEDSAKRVKLINKFCEHNLRLVTTVAKQYTRNRVKGWNSENTADVLQQGYLGLRRAVEKFDPERGYRFSTYACNWIRQSISRYAMNETGCVRVPEGTLRELFYQGRHGKPSNQKGTTTNPAHLAAAYRATTIGSLDAKINEDSDLLEVISEEHRLNAFVTDPNDSMKKIQALLDKAGIKGPVRELVTEYAKRGRLSSAATAAKFPHGKAREAVDSAIEKMRHAA